ncbi:vesicular, overexpressed in cancer, prosurvival protein 1-like isoform X2 [Dreissena polymorpha]|uniref:vesicular, overexpressed in cancer, prosurvival protein 1-like isoform X2 n=1 Tax=Dreissena polymorpha TaxID=45954 RepID=UPI002263C77A|nr:vesicular, overexpressed in cancer, prosurvival protein 1-like isoform X2 [Dreissena polymorpha]
MDIYSLCSGPLKSECKYCWHKSGFGKSEYFYCSAFQYCCGDKCCENIAEFYKLWYFWLCALVLALATFAALYWFCRRYASPVSSRSSGGDRSRSHRSRSSRRYRHLSGEGHRGATGSVVIPNEVVISPPPYCGNNSGCPHLGPPPYALTLGSGSSINSQTLPRCPPSYNDIEKHPPPSYSSQEEVYQVKVTHCDKRGNKGDS